jgi:hypothetical protein
MVLARHAAALVAGLAVINATGVYAQLVAAHVGERRAATLAIDTLDAAGVAAHNVADLERRLGQIDTAIEEAARRGKTATALAAIESQKRARAALADERKREAGTLVALQSERATVAAQGRRIGTCFGRDVLLGACARCRSANACRESGGG